MSISLNGTNTNYLSIANSLGQTNASTRTVAMWAKPANSNADKWAFGWDSSVAGGGLFKADATYRGLEEDKPFHRIITVNGQQFSSSEPITIGLAGGWGDARHTNFHLPEVVVTDTYLVGSGTLPTSSVPSFATPPNAPAIPTIVLTDDTDDLTWNYPYGWTIVGTPHAATLNSQISAMVYSIVYRYIWPVMFR